MVLDYNPKLPDVSEVLKKHSNILANSLEVRELFPSGSIFPAYRRTKNLKDFLAPSRFKGNQHPTSSNLHVAGNGCFKCDRKCDLCNNYFTESASFQSCATGRSYKIKQRLNCSSANAVYLATCTKCNLQYVGSTSTEFKVRFRNHKSAMKTNKKTCEVAIHFNSTPHTLSDFQFICIEKILQQTDIESKLITREAYWTAQLRTLRPYGLNKRQEFRSKNRIHY